MPHAAVRCLPAKRIGARRTLAVTETWASPNSRVQPKIEAGGLGKYRAQENSLRLTWLDRAA